MDTDPAPQYWKSPFSWGQNLGVRFQRQYCKQALKCFGTSTNDWIVPESHYDNTDGLPYLNNSVMDLQDHW
jgi:hypothetical protein